MTDRRNGKIVRGVAVVLAAASVMCSTVLAVEIPLVEAWTATGSYGTVQAGVGTLNTNGDGTISNVTVPGTVAKAFLYWVGRNGPADDVSSDAMITLTRSGSIGSDVNASVTSDISFMPFWNHNHVAFIADVTDYVASGTFDYSISSFNMSSVEYGVGLQIVYEDASLPTTEVSIFQGHDFAYLNWPGPQELDRTDVVNYTFEAADVDRVLDVAFLAAGAEEAARPDQLWFKTGMHEIADDLPAELITNNLGSVLDDNALIGNDGPAWDTWEGQILIPAGSTYASFQFESGGGSGTGNPESFSWVSASFQLAPIPEPATLAFLALGAVALLRGRRR